MNLQKAVRTCQFILVTPALAKEWLALNVNNRAKRAWWVNSLSNMMRRGEWITTHQGIAFSEDGALLDGQHRLEGIVESGIAQEMLVVTGLPNDAYKVLDNGIKRTMSDLTGINARTSEVCRILARMAFSSRVHTSAEECLSVYNSGVGEVADDLMEYCGKQVKVYSSAPLKTAAICLILDGHNPQYIKDVYSNLCHQKFNELPTIALNFMRQVNDNKVNSSNKPDLIARGLKVFNSDYKDFTRLQISDAETSAAAAYCKGVVLNMLDKSLASQLALH